LPPPSTEDHPHVMTETKEGQAPKPPQRAPKSPPTTPPESPTRNESPTSSSKLDTSSDGDQDKRDAKSGRHQSPPRGERHAPEGTSCPSPRPTETPPEDSPTKPPPGYLSPTEVDALLKRQEDQFKQRLARASKSSGSKETSQMREEKLELDELRRACVDVTKSREALLKMLEQYKEMLAAVVKDKTEAAKQAEEKLRAVEEEKGQAFDDLANVENAFSDVHRKYERTKQVVETLRRNEESLRGAVGDYEARIRKQDESMGSLQRHAEEKLNIAAEEYDGLRRTTDQELTKMGALLKKAEMKIKSLQEQLDRKSQDNTELTQLLDDLIAKMGPVLSS